MKLGGDAKRSSLNGFGELPSTRGSLSSRSDYLLKPVHYTPPMPTSGEVAEKQILRQRRDSIDSDIDEELAEHAAMASAGPAHRDTSARCGDASTVVPVGFLRYSSTDPSEEFWIPEGLALERLLLNFERAGPSITLAHHYGPSPLHCRRER